MTLYRGLGAHRFAAPKSEDGIDPRQLFCAILHNELIFLEYAIDHNTDDGKCESCRSPRPKWGKCPECGLLSEYVRRLGEVITFFESEFAYILCCDAGIDYDAYIRVSKERFAQIPKRRRNSGLREAKKWWDRNRR